MSAAGEGPALRWHELRRLIALAWVHRLRFVVMTGSTALHAGVGGLLLYLAKVLWERWSAVQAAMDGHVAPEQAGPVIAAALEGMQTAAWQAAAIAPLAAGTAYLAWYSGQALANEVMRDLRARFVGHLVAQEIAFHDQLARGELLARMTSDLDRMRGMMRVMAGRLLIRPFEILGLLGALVIINWKLGLILIAVILPLGAVAARLAARTRRRSQQARVSQEKVFTDFEQITAGIRVVKSMGSAEQEMARYGAANDRFATDNLKLARTRAQSEAVTEGGVFLVFAVGMAVGAWLFSSGGIEPVALVLVLAAVGRMATAVRELQRSLSDIIEGQPVLVRVFEILDRIPAIRSRPDPLPAAAPRRAITLDGVRFRYHPDAGEVLRGIDLDIPAGKTTALVGQSGGGKTTILDLIPRLRDTTAGSVRWDGVDVRDLDQAGLMRQVAIVNQEAFLFDDTIRANIRYGRPSATDAEIEQAARRAHVHEAILSLEGGLGYDTRVGDRGGRLSGGQRQRVAIARALLRDAPVLLLDEPTSALDAESEHQVQLALAELMKDRTVVVIAHRLATVQHADRIHVIAGKDDPEPGTVLESGTHAELVARGGAYARLAARQRLD